MTERSTTITLERDGDVVQIVAHGPDSISRKFNVIKSTFDAGVHERHVIAIRSSWRRAHRHFVRIVESMYDDGWTPIDGGGIFSKANQS